jgi:hypothetical protein
MGVAATALVATILKSIRPLLDTARQPWLVADYPASQWWLDYDHVGFSRRGLPGEVLTWFAGGTPSAWQVSAAALTVTVAAIGSIAWLAWALGRRAEPTVRLGVVALVLASPFTLGQQIRDVGRYDAIGVCALALLVAVAGRRRATPFVVAVVVLVAGLSQELLAAFVIPVAVLVTAAGRTGWRAAAVPVAAIAPGLVATAVSCLARPTVPELASTEAAAQAARPDIVPGTTSIAALWQTPAQAVAHLEVMKWWVLPSATLLLGGCFVAFTALLWYLVGRPARFHRYAGWFALASVGVSLTAVDYQRWWSLAFVSAVAVLALLPLPERRPAVTVSRRFVGIVAAVLVVGVGLQLGPINAERLDHSSRVVIELPPS